MATTKEKEKKEDLSAGDAAALFIHNHRRPIQVVMAVIAVGIIGFIATVSVRGALEKKAIIRVDEYARRFAELGDPASASGTDTLLEELNEFAPKTFGYAAGKAYSLAAEIYAAKNEWALAEEAWVAAAKKAPKIFLTPFSLYSAAVAAEEQGKLDKAIEYHTLCVEYAGLNPAAAHSQFSIGRILEQRNNKEEAIAAYRKVIENWSGNTNWSNLARNRIIALEL
ncbi:MAG: tetratricopeptide repeat protein [Treponema sp.]|jgi:tetratricopeptide (TPR) repeat protein|nr:tetratricopeptide repeat protein [Treponema sp.]